MLYRDRKALYANIVNAFGYVVILYWLVNVAIYGWGRGPVLVKSRWVWCAVLADSFLMVHRLIQRFVAVVRTAGWYQAFLSIPRSVVGNAINFVATVMATEQFFSAERSGKRVEWKKTAHAFPTAEQLMEHRRLLGDLLLENRLITLVQLKTALLAQQKDGKKLGQEATELGYISEEDLLAVLGRQLAVPFGSIDYRTVDQSWLRKLPRATAEAWLALPLRASNGVLEIACADPGAPQLEATRGSMGCTVSLRLASEPNLRFAISQAYLSSDGHAGPLLGELLVEALAITRLDLDHALEIQKASGRRLGEILQDLGLISPEMLTETLQSRESAPFRERKVTGAGPTCLLRAAKGVRQNRNYEISCETSRFSDAQDN